MEHPGKNINNPNVANKGVRISDTLLQGRNNDMVLSIEESSLSTTTDQNLHNLTNTSGSSEQEQYYRLLTGDHTKFVGKSPSKLEFQLVKPVKSNMSRKKQAKKSIKFNPQHFQCTCNKGRGDGTAINICDKNNKGLNSSWTQKMKEFFEKHKNKSNYDSKQDIENAAKLYQVEEERHTEENSDNNVIVYHFEHGCPEFYKTFDCPPHLISDILAQQTAHHATRFWAEMFGFINIGVTFFVTFFLQFYRFLLYAIFKIFVVGMLQITSDYFIKPLLSVIFNGFLQPPLTFTQNILISIGNVLDPVAKCLDNFLMPIGNVFRALRLIEINRWEARPNSTSNNCKHEKQILMNQNLV